MSRSNPTPTNPATRFFEWSGSKGQFGFYDKEKKETINVPLPFEFLVLDELATITGYSKRDESGYWSNEVRSVTKDTLTVRTKHGVAQEGLYSELADVRAKGAKYAKSIYLVYKTKQGWEIGNFKAHGSALSAWIEFSQTCVVQNGKVILTKGEQQEAPTGAFYSPELTYEHSTPEEDGIAIGLDKELQTYLNQYLAAAEFNRSNENKGDIEIEDIDPDLGKATPEQQADYDERKKKTRDWDKVGKGESAKKSDGDDEAVKEYQKIASDIGEEPINLNDIPF